VFAQQFNRDTCAAIPLKGTMSHSAALRPLAPLGMLREGLRAFVAVQVSIPVGLLDQQMFNCWTNKSELG